MIVLGVDAHKRTHTVVAVDGNGAELGRLTVAATGEGHLRLLRWAARFGARRWAVEDCRCLSRRLEADLLSAGEQVVRVPPKLMAGARRGARTWGKSDPIDALAVARLALREPDLPVACLDGDSRPLRLLVDYRETLVRERSRAQNRLRWRLHELEPGFDPPAGALRQLVGLDRVETMLQGHQGPVADLAQREVARIRQLTLEANQLEAQISRMVTTLTPHLVALPGCGPLTAAKLVGEVADIRRFRSPDAFAMWAGTAPIPAWSGNTTRFRLNRGGNRQANTALHRIAITQIRIHPPARDYLEKRLASGDTKKEALRALKRRLAGVVYRTLQADATTQKTDTQTLAA